MEVGGEGCSVLADLFQYTLSYFGSQAVIYCFLLKNHPHLYATLGHCAHHPFRRRSGPGYKMCDRSRDCWCLQGEGA